MPQVMELDSLRLRALAKERLETLKQESPHINVYEPLSDKHMVIHMSEAKERWAFTGNRFGKTSLMILEDIWHATGEYPSWYPEGGKSPCPCDGRIVCTDFVNGIEKIILPTLFKWLPKGSLKEYSKQKRIIYLMNGSTIDCMSQDQDVQAFAGVSRHWTHFDEHGRYDIYLECKMRLLDTSGRFWSSLTPELGMSWEFDTILEKEAGRKELEIFRGATMDNPTLSPDEIERMKEGLSPEEIRVKLYGDMVALTGKVYKEFNKADHVIEPFYIPREWKRVRAIDPHINKPTAVTWIVVSPEQNYYVYDEALLTDVRGDTLPISECAKAIKAKDGLDRISLTLMDSKIGNVEATLYNMDSVKAEFQRHGIWSRDGIADPDYRILKVRERLKLKEPYKKPTIYFFNNCVKTIWQMEHYVYKETTRVEAEKKDPTNKVKKKDDDLVDCVGYICAEDVRYTSAHTLLDISKLSFKPTRS